MHVRN